MVRTARSSASVRQYGRQSGAEPLSLSAQPRRPDCFAAITARRLNIAHSEAAVCMMLFSVAYLSLWEPLAIHHPDRLTVTSVMRVQHAVSRSQFTVRTPDPLSPSPLGDCMLAPVRAAGLHLVPGKHDSGTTG
jgi:hypothetical protein